MQQHGHDHELRRQARSKQCLIGPAITKVSPGDMGEIV